MTIFALAAPAWVWAGLKEYPVGALIDRAVARLRTRYPKTERRGDEIIVNAEAYSAAIQLLATEEPYRLDEGLLFLPFACRSGPTVEEAIRLAEDARIVPVLRWYGSMESARLLLTVGDTELAGGAVVVEPRGHHVYYARHTTDDDVVTLANGEPLRRWRSFPQFVFVVRKSSPDQPSMFVLFEGISGLCHFARQPSLWGVARTALIHAELRGLARSYAVVDRPPPDWKPTAPALVTLTVSTEDKRLAIVAAGDRDALLVFGDHLREELSGYKLALGIAEPGEDTPTFQKRIEAELERS